MVVTYARKLLELGVSKETLVEGLKKLSEAGMSQADIEERIGVLEDMTATDEEPSEPAGPTVGGLRGRQTGELAGDIPPAPVSLVEGGAV